MNLQSLIEFLLDEKKKAQEEAICEERSFDDETVTNVELSLGDIDQIVEILSAFNDVSGDEDWDEDEE